MLPPVKHDDVYEMVTTDPDEHPLPCLGLLQIQYAARKLLGGMAAADALQTIFSADPPDVDLVSDWDGVAVPAVWE